MNWSSCTGSLPSSDMHPAGRATQFSGDSAVKVQCLMQTVKPW